MINTKLFNDLYNIAPENGDIVIFGACSAGEKIMKDLAVYKPETKVIGFIDNNTKGTFCSLPVWTLKQFIDLNNSSATVIMSTKTDESKIINLLDIYNVPVIMITDLVSKYYRSNTEILSDENYKKVINIFDKQDDKDLFDVIFKIRKNLEEPDYLFKRHYGANNNKYGTYHILRKQYLEKINNNKIKIVLDCGLNDGLNVIAFNKFLPNLEKVYGFDAIYDVVRKKYIEDFIINDKLEIVPLALGDKCAMINFCINKINLGASFVEDITGGRKCPANSPCWECRTVEVSTIDKFCNERSILPDFIKMDIEGAELSALIGGLNIIQKSRPQLAVSIYHTYEDFINIPLYLYENLENYKFALGHYSPALSETVLYAIPQELMP